jgi:hypothetical protein
MSKGMFSSWLIPLLESFDAHYTRTKFFGSTSSTSSTNFGATCGTKKLFFFILYEMTGSTSSTTHFVPRHNKSEYSTVKSVTRSPPLDSDNSK